jgi:penicillin amidase
LAFGIAGILAVVAVQTASSPQRGRVQVAGLSGPVEIIRDSYGIPHIFAPTDTDAYLALGYVHAQDRAWQMEMARRAGSGRLSEIFGEASVSQDRLMRTIGIQHAAETNLTHLDEKTRQLLEAYTQGVNARFSETRTPAVEFFLGGFTPASWQPADSLAGLKLMAWNLSGNWWEELLNLRLKRRLSTQQMADLFPPYPGDGEIRLPDLTRLYSGLDEMAGRLMAASPPSARSSLGSNNWVVGGLRTQSGKPLLANDPHLKFSAPAVWYLAHLRAPGLDVIGATIPGVPAVMLGRNRQVAWAFTNTGSDTQDIYLEKLLPGDSGRYRTPGGSEEFERHVETLKIDGAPDERFLVRVSRHGPVISDVADEAAAVLPAGMAMALRWVGLEPDDRTLQFMIHAAAAGNASELHAAAHDFHAPQQNIVYADSSGQIGFVAAGRVPIRRPENDLFGLVPAPGWDERYDWAGYIPFDELPQQTGSETGKIVTANQKITPPGYPYWLTSGWALPYRADRIAMLLDTVPKHTAASFAAIQVDVGNPFAEQLLPHLLKVRPANQDELAAIEKMRAWNAEMSTERPEPLIFAEWIRQLAILVYGSVLGELFDSVGDYNPQFLLKVLSDQESQSRWCGDAPKEDRSPCMELVEKALRTALAQLRQRYGPDLDQWSWGMAHPALARHQAFGDIPMLSRLFNVKTPSPGGMDTINVSGYAFDPDSGQYLGEAGPSFRAIYDLDQPDNSIFILNTGQSGRPLSPHYRDMAPLWADGGYVPMITDRAKVEKDAAEFLVLSPRPIPAAANVSSLDREKK